MATRKLTKAQREWILERDEHRCQFHGYVGSKLVRCPTTSPLNVHHIKPHRFLLQLLGSVEEKPENLITLCTVHHICKDGGYPDNCVHPDTETARRAYSKNKSSYHDMAIERNKKLQRGEKYWVDRWDSLLEFIAQEATRCYSKKHQWPS
jgi:hypothetical protein